MRPLPAPHLRPTSPWKIQVYPRPAEPVSYAAGRADSGGRSPFVSRPGPAGGANRAQTRRDAREAEGAPLLREYRVKSLIEGSNPSLSARHKKAPFSGA